MTSRKKRIDIEKGKTEHPNRKKDKFAGLPTVQKKDEQIETGKEFVKVYSKQIMEK